MGKRVAQALEHQAAIIQSLGHDLRGSISNALAVLESSEMKEEDRTTLRSHFAHAEAILDPIVQYSQSTLRDGAFEETDIIALAIAVAEPFNQEGERVRIAGPSSLFVRSRFNALRRLFANLIENAVKYAGNLRVAIRPAGDMVGHRLRR